MATNGYEAYQKVLKSIQREQDRLKNIETFQPVYMDEYEALEIDLKENYNKYVDHNLHYLKKH